MEEWKPVLDFPGYSISRSGELRKDSSGRILAYKVNQYGVIYVGLMREHRQHQRSLALLVASAFIPRPFGPMDTPIHLDGDRYNNSVDNLVWRPRWFAVFYNRQFKIPYDNPFLVPIVDLATDREYKDSFDCAKIHGLLERDVVLSILNRTYVWPTYQQFGVLED